MKKKTLRTVAQVMEWFSTVQLRMYSPVASRERERIRGMFVKRYGEYKLTECNAGMLLEFLESFPSLTSQWTRRRWVATLVRPFNMASRLGLIGRNPFFGLQLPPGDRGRDLTREEFSALLANSIPPFRRLLVFLRCSGARPGEARGLEWSMVNLEIGAIVIKEHKTRFHLKMPAPRRIPLNSIMVKLLSWIARHRPDPDFVFVNSMGKKWSINAVCKTIRKLRRKLGLPEDVKLYGNRHAFATQAIVSGIDVATLMELLGHRSLKTTQIYLHLAGQTGHLNAAMEKAGRINPSKPGSGSETLARPAEAVAADTAAAVDLADKLRRLRQEPKKADKARKKKRTPGAKGRLKDLLKDLFSEMLEEEGQ